MTDLNVPVPVPHVVKAQLVCDLSRVHGLQQIKYNLQYSLLYHIVQCNITIYDVRSSADLRQVLLVGEHQHHGLPQLVLGQHAVELVPRLRYPLPVIAVHHEYQPVCVLGTLQSVFVIHFISVSCRV